jgi:hypothetical protein
MATLRASMHGMIPTINASFAFKIALLGGKFTVAFEVLNHSKGK